MTNESISYSVCAMLMHDASCVDNDGKKRHANAIRMIQLGDACDDRIRARRQTPTNDMRRALATIDLGFLWESVLIISGTVERLVY